ncbi:hypothetical protein [Dietzia cercidiphylli]|uniref:hypothetical protein n=1 Tax=Dietzia cercidiphylli TaxID=498199 RepID=UPI00223B3EE3|nr:hypothetical protein [Dietzia cercidiphylli]MCT1514559.1 hypothetical protein [Dietzia cercidiphylli]
MIESLQDFTGSLPTWLQWVGVMAAGAIPFIESYFGSVIGVIAGLPTPLAIAAAVVGNIATMLLLVLGAHAVRGRTARPDRERSPKRQRLRRTFDKYGVAGVSLLGQTILPSQITSAALVSFGAPKNAVILWQVISIVLWGTAFGVLATLGVNLLGDR